MESSLDTLSGLLVALPAGLIFGSFAAATAWRLPRGLNWITGRSQCPHCQHILGLGDLIPLVSWIMARGRCRHCEVAVSARYPVTELAMAGLFALPVLVHGGLWPNHLLLWLLAVLLMILSLVDIAERYLPDGCTLMVAFCGVVGSLTGYNVGLQEGLLAALVLGSVTGLLRLLASRVLRREALGLGDVKLFAAGGLWLGPAGIGPFILGAALLGILFHLARAGWNQEDPEIPFGPAIAASLYFMTLYPADIYLT